MEIVGLYEYNDVYQVINQDGTVLLQDSKEECEKYVEENS